MGVQSLVQELLRTGAAAMDAGWAAALEGNATNSERASNFLAAELIASGQEHLFWTTEEEFFNQRIGLKELFANEEALGAIRDYASIENSFTREELWAATGEGSGDGLKDVVGVSNEQDILSTAAFLFGGDRYRSEVISNAFNEGAEDVAYMDVENRLRVMQGDWLGLERDLSRSATSMGIALGSSLGWGLASRPLNGYGVGGSVVPGKQLSSVHRIEANDINLRYDSPAAKAEGWEPPFVQDSKIRRVTTAEGAEIPFKRVHVDVDDPVGRFLFRESEIAHLGNDAEKIRVYLGLKEKPNYISDVYIPGNVDLNVGRIGAQPSFGLNSTSGFQYHINGDVNPIWFMKNPPEALK